MAGNAIEPGGSVTSKVVVILLAFRDGEEHSLTEIARLSCMPVSTIHRLETELAGWGLLERTDESQFRVVGPFRAIGRRAARSPYFYAHVRRGGGELTALWDPPPSPEERQRAPGPLSGATTITT